MTTRIYMLVVFLIGAFVATAVCASDVTGNVVDKSTNHVVPFATVQVAGTSLGCVADSVGQFHLSKVPKGKHTLVVSSVGFQTLMTDITIVEGQDSHVPITLTASQLDAGSIVVTGTRTPRYVKDVPVYTEVVSRALIEDKSAHNVYEALDGEAGVRVEQQCQGCNFSILRMQGLGADHTQILLDGQPVYSGLASVYGLQQMSTADVDRIEIVKGAGSALYGSSAVAGAINIISSVPYKSGGTIGVEFGEHGTNKYNVSASARRDKLGIFLFAQQTEQDELDETGDVNAPGGVDEPDGWLDRVRASSRNGGFNLFLDNALASNQLIIRGRALSETRQGGFLTDNLFENPFAPGTERIVTDRYSGQVEYILRLESGTELHTSVSYTDHHRDATNDTFLGDYEETLGEMPPVDLLRPYVADENLLIVTADFNQPLAGSHHILGGVQYTHNKLEESGMYLDSDTEEPYVSASEKKANEIGIYFQDEFNASEKLEIVAGVRLDYHSSEDEFRGSGDVLPQGLKPLEYDESSVNPRFAVRYAATPDLVLRGSVGTGFRVPYGFSEDLHLCSGSPRVYKGGDLKPEKSLSYSFTADYAKSKFTASLNLYRTELQDAIAFADADEQISELGYSYEWQNIDDAHVMGAEFNSSIALTRNLVMGARFEVFEGEYDNVREDWVGTPFEDISKNISRYPQTSGGIKLDYANAGWGVIVDADYKGKMYIDLTEPANEDDIQIYETESFVLVNAKISKKVFDNYTLYLGAHNLTDYTQVEKHVDDAAFMYAPVYGRIIYGGVNISF